MHQMFKNNKVLVTGGAGFIGTNLIKRLLGSGADIRATFHRQEPKGLSDKVDYIKADLKLEKDCQKVVQGIDYVFMCSAYSSGAEEIDATPLVHVTPNIVMTAFMLEAAYKAGVKKFLYMSSCVIYPLSDTPLKEERGHDDPLFDKYFLIGSMKRYGEKLCQAYSEKIKNPMPVVVVRPTSVYGPHESFDRRKSHVIPALIRKVVERHDPIEVWGNGTALKDFIFIDDLVEGMLLAMEKMNVFMPVNLGSGEQTSIRDIIDAIIRIDNYDNARIIFNPSKPVMLPKMLIDITRAKEVLDFKATTSVEEGLRKTVEWYRQNKTTD